MKIVGKILAVLYSILFTLITFILFIFLCCTSLLKESFYQDLFKNVDLKEISASDLGLSDKEGESLEEYFTHTIEDMGIDKKTAEKILENDELKGVVGDIMGKVVNYMATGEEAPRITKEEVDKVLENEEVKKIFDADFKEDDLNELVDMVNGFLKEFADSRGEENE